MGEYRCTECETPYGTVEEASECCSCERCAKLEAQLEAMDEPINQLRSWCRAYPYDIFIEVEDIDWRKANTVLKAAGISMTAMNGSNMRHVIAGVAKIADALGKALEEI